jgi:hypothetical protein
VKEFQVVAKKWPEMVLKWLFLSYEFSIFIFTKLQKQEMTKIVFYVVAFDSNKIWAC